MEAGTGEAFALPPISPEEPCGPDLDLDGDAEFMNFTAALEGQLPASFFAFDRKSIDYAQAFATADKLIQRTHDVRLFVLLAKLSILNRDVDGFARWVGVTAHLLATEWEHVHPRGESGDYSFRLAQLQTLDDGPVVVLPLQYATLVETSRDGAVNYRAQMVATGEANPREGETLASTGAMEKVLTNVDLNALVKRAETIQGLKDSLSAITRTTQEQAGFEVAVSFKGLAPLVAKIADFLQGALARRDPRFAPPTAEAAASVETGAAAAAAPSAFASLSDLDAALGSALGYFLNNEPSSPALLLVGQARETLGKTLYDVMRLLAPSHADEARVFVGSDQPFSVPVSALSSTASHEVARTEAEPAASRAAALALIDAVAAHLRKNEPSSPGPYLLDRARALATRDFLSLLSDILPEETLSAMKSGR